MTGEARDSPRIYINVIVIIYAMSNKSAEIERMYNELPDIENNIINIPKESSYSRLCSICLTDVFDDEYKTSCGHLFHKKCIESCYIKYKFCPYCRNKIVLETATEAVAESEASIESSESGSCIQGCNNCVNCCFKNSSICYVFLFVLFSLMLIIIVFNS